MIASPGYVMFPLVWITLAVILAWSIAVIVVQRERIQNPAPAGSATSSVPSAQNLPKELGQTAPESVARPIPSIVSVWGAAKAPAVMEKKASPVLVPTPERQFPFLFSLEMLGTTKAETPAPRATVASPAYVAQSPAWPIISESASETPSLLGDLQLDEDSHSSRSSSRASTPKSQTSSSSSSSNVFSDDKVNASFSTTPSLSPAAAAAVPSKEHEIYALDLTTGTQIDESKGVASLGFVLGGKASILQFASDGVIYNNLPTVSQTETVALADRTLNIDETIYDYLGEEGGKIVTKRFPFGNFFRYGKLVAPADAPCDTMVKFHRVLAPGVPTPQKLMQLPFALPGSSLWTHVPAISSLSTSNIENCRLLNNGSGIVTWKRDLTPRKQKIIPWYLKRIGAKPRNAVPLDDGSDVFSAAKSKNVMVFVLDNGIAKHARLNVLSHIDFCPPEENPQEDDGLQATMVAGIIGARESADFGIMGVCPGVALHSIKIQPVHILETDLAHILVAFEYILSTKALAAAQGVELKIIVHVGFDLNWSASDVLKSLAQRLEQHKIIVVQPTGSAPSVAAAPSSGAHRNIITVSGYNQRNCTVSSSSATLWAPSDEMLTTEPNDHYCYASGTVLGSAVVAGTLARYFTSAENKNSTMESALEQINALQTQIGDMVWTNPRITPGNIKSRGNIHSIGKPNLEGGISIYVL